MASLTTVENKRHHCHRTVYKIVEIMENCDLQLFKQIFAFSYCLQQLLYPKCTTDVWQTQIWWWSVHHPGSCKWSI